MSVPGVWPIVAGCWYLCQMVEKKLWPACLPDIDTDFSGRTSYVAGWGITQTKFIRVSSATWYLECLLW